MTVIFCQCHTSSASLALSRYGVYVLKVLQVAHDAYALFAYRQSIDDYKYLAKLFSLIST